MARQIQLTFLLAIIACLVHGAPFEIETNGSEQDLEIRADIDKTVDALLPSIRKFILDNGMDPMQIADVSEHIFPLLPGILKGTVDLKNGWIQNLALVKRTGHVTAIYKSKRLTLDMNLGFDVMDCNYEYSLKYLLFKRQGDVNARFHQLDVNVVTTVDLNEYILILDSIKFSDVRKYDIKFEGHVLDRLLNAVAKIITVVFKNLVLPFIERQAEKIFSAKLDEWNSMIPQPNRTEIINRWLDIVKT
ncbi:PREDICTED: uncharacterized protein LOC105562897 [Vollenhovia emeryi]|uniref:uncharacterized protein LOC105562897 n=1 Tax=Vollenhovia emeryi TaxID=411798 RepID=UPI0005F45F86|nr:PREDICTED: uncharacterized protein LOC105562897 [Vollenhovia emeryi]